MTAPRAVLQHPSMETPKHQFNTRVCTIPDGHRRTVFHGIRGEAPDPNRADGSAPGSSRRGPGSASAGFGSEAGLKPVTDETRRMPPFGSPKGEERHDQASRRRTGGVASSQVDPPQGGTGAPAQRHERWRDRSPLRLPECMDGPTPPAFVRPPAAPREVRLNGFPEALAEVPRHRFGGGGCRVRGAVPTGVFGASKVGQYPSHKRTPVFRGATCLAAPLCDASASAPVLARFDHP